MAENTAEYWEKRLSRRTESAASKNPGHMEAIGLVSVHYALLELGLNSFVWGLLGVDEETGATITSQLRGEGALRVLIASLFVAKGHGAMLEEELTRLLSRIGKLGERRNQMIHAVWALGASGETLARIRVAVRNGYRLESIQVRANDIHKLAEELLTAMQDLRDFKERLGYTLGSHI